MRFPFKVHYERMLLGVALTAAIASAGWAWHASAEVRRIRAISVALRLANSDYQPKSLLPATPAPVLWGKPVVQSGGEGWLYEIFTPPVVFYNPKLATFTVAPTLDSSEAVVAFNLELVGVKQELYRLQLVGYFGEPGAYTAVFTYPTQPGTLPAKEGARFADLGLSLRHFSVQRIARKGGTLSLDFEIAALAELFDERTGAAVTLDSRTRKFADAPVAWVKFPSASPTPKEARVGDEFTDHGITYRIEHIQSSPAEMVVTRHQPGSSLIETKTIRMERAASAGGILPARVSGHTLSRPATGSVINEK